MGTTATKAMLRASGDLRPVLRSRRTIRAVPSPQRVQSVHL